MIATQESLRINLRSLFDVFLPPRTAWWAVFGNTLSGGLSGIRFVSSCFSIIQQSFVTGWGACVRWRPWCPPPRSHSKTVGLSAKCDEEG